MKRYIKASDDKELIQDIRKDINSYIDEYYDAIGYDTREYTIPKCHIKKEKSSDEDTVYKISVDIDVYFDYNVDIICKNLDDCVDFYVSYYGYELYQEFSLDKDSIFVGYIRKI